MKILRSAFLVLLALSLLAPVATLAATNLQLPQWDEPTPAPPPPPLPPW